MPPRKSTKVLHAPADTCPHSLMLLRNWLQWSWLPWERKNCQIPLLIVTPAVMPMRRSWMQLMKATLVMRMMILIPPWLKRSQSQFHKNKERLLRTPLHQNIWFVLVPAVWGPWPIRSGWFFPMKIVSQSSFSSYIYGLTLTLGSCNGLLNIVGHITGSWVSWPLCWRTGFGVISVSTYENVWRRVLMTYFSPVFWVAPQSFCDSVYDILHIHTFRVCLVYGLAYRRGRFPSQQQHDTLHRRLALPH